MHSPTVVFDLDGTIVDTAPDLVAALAVALAMERLTPLPLPAARPLIGGGVWVLLRRGLDHHPHNVSDARFEELAAAVLASYEANIAVASRPYPGLAAMLDRLAAEGITTAVCTNKPDYLALKLLDALDLTTRFAAVGGAGTFAANKPDPRHLLGTIALAGGEPATSVMVGDSMTDVNAARAAKVPVIAVDYGYTEVMPAEFGADALVSALAEIPDAAALLLSGARRAASTAPSGLA
jgi:phosphoglycolate phosphatase